ncbi:TPR repeat-containing protein [Pseudodesulfovibrio profundus]|uniref:TPR repeat-containing protein n=1 Tax=Pseudodesulfovibrio profundus TaxID=57320 RepID=A0A2C8FE62_9BACT|nr:tetratricopeptide repeat protein [Pseudodesulfovibrio profundus]SOB60789.1 TPR repeat-containing protein [Pseudodesulfovibrio profundus]
MATNAVNFSRKTIIAAVLLCAAAMFITSFVYRMNHPNLFVQVEQQHSPDDGHDHSTDGTGAPAGMSEGAMAKVKEFMAQVKENPNDVKALINLGNSFLMMRAWDRALEPLEKANSLEPGNIGLLKAIGIAYFNKENFDKAAEAYKQILAIDPNDTLALFNLGVINKYYFEDMDTARTYFEKVLVIEKDDEEIIKMAKQELDH